jgi:hypothetical protein
MFWRGRVFDERKCYFDSVTKKYNNIFTKGVCMELETPFVFLNEKNEVLYYQY